MKWKVLVLIGFVLAIGAQSCGSSSTSPTQPSTSGAGTFTLMGTT